MSPSPMPTRPRSRVRLWPPRRNSTTPRRTSSGVIRPMSKESTWTIRVVPTFAPSMTARAGTSESTPVSANERNEAACGEGGHHQARSGAALKDSGDARTHQEGFQAVAERQTQSTPEAWAEGALDAALAHVHATEQERHGAGEIQKCERGRHDLGPMSSQTSQIVKTGGLWEA